MKSNKLFVALAFILLVAASSCNTVSKTISEPNTRVNLTSSDFTLSEQVNGTAQTVKVFGIDWRRISKNEAANISGQMSLAAVPVIGTFVSDKTTNYALYNMLLENPGYDVVFYPTYTTRVRKPVLGIGFIYKKTTVYATGRLGKLKANK
jgi:hypothetical protein